MSVRLSVHLSVRMSVRQPRLGGNVIFSAPNWDIAPIFFVQIPLINGRLFCKYFVRLPVGNATKCFATYGCCHPCFILSWMFKDVSEATATSVVTTTDSAAADITSCGAMTHSGLALPLRRKIWLHSCTTRWFSNIFERSLSVSPILKVATQLAVALLCF